MRRTLRGVTDATSRASTRSCPSSGWRFVAFRFELDGRSYTWHQPEELVRWDYSAVPQYQDANDWQPEAERPLELSRRQFAQTKALIRWVLARPLGTKEAQ